MIPRTDHLSSIREDSYGLLVCDHFSHPLKGNSSCETIEDFIRLNMDAVWITDNRTIAFMAISNEPSTTIQVEIGPELGPGFADMRAVYDREVGGQTFVNLGIWNKGEGRHSIRAVLQNTMVSLLRPDEFKDPTKIATKCPNPSHSAASQFCMQKKVDPNSTYKSVCLFNIIFEKMCTECLSVISANDPDGLAGVPF